MTNVRFIVSLASQPETCTMDSIRSVGWTRTKLALPRHLESLYSVYGTAVGIKTLDWDSVRQSRGCLA